MNIKEAKEQIINAIKAYYAKNRFGEYVIPQEKQRPVFLMGPAGIGKTEIMEQIAEELNVGLVSYSMTHHTRQSAIGLPFITTKKYDGVDYQVSEYTMSEIIASVYDMMEKTNKKECILFLDEVNCVSETLAPAMLQFLQYKVFGQHKLPNGCVIVTAGNPPEYNKSVKEFDVVTWDRLKRIDVEANFDIWKEYAFKIKVHPAITTYLNINKENFYKVESTVDGKTIVTARAWTDLSNMIRIFEEKDIKVDYNLVAQYIQNNEIAKDFAIYYDLFNKYKVDYKVDDILNGKYSDNMVKKVQSAKFDERLALIGLAIDSLTSIISDVMEKEAVLFEVKNIVIESKTSVNILEYLLDVVNKKNEEITIGKHAQSLSTEKEYILRYTIELLDNLIKKLKMNNISNENVFKFLANNLKELTEDQNKKSIKDKELISNVFKFFIEACGESSNEVLILVTELTRNVHTALFINKYGCEEYFKSNKDLLFNQRNKEIIEEIDKVEKEKPHNDSDTIIN